MKLNLKKHPEFIKRNYENMYYAFTIDMGEDINRFEFELTIGRRVYTFTKDILNHIYVHWKVINRHTKKTESRLRKIGKILNGQFVLEVNGGDRLTKNEIYIISDFFSKNFSNENDENNLPYIKLLNAQNLSREEWLKERQAGIGGSDLGAILGLSKWSNPYKVWLEKTGQAIEEELTKEKERMFEIGNHNEELVSKYFQEDTGKQVKEEPYILQSKQYPFMLANIDRWVVGENAGLECKTTSNFSIIKDLKQDKVPEQYQLQCLHYMAVTGAEAWYISTFDLIGKKLYTVTIKRDAEVNKIIDFIIQKEKEFWQLVENKTEPEIVADGEDVTTKRLLNLNFNNDEQIFLTDESKLKLLDSIKAQIKELEKQEEKIKQEILLKMEGNSKAISENFEIKVIESNRSTFDKKKLFELVEISEEIKEKCTKTSTSKTLKIKKLEEK